MFRALYAERKGAAVSLRELEESAQPRGNVHVRVEYSGLNYKDALALTGRAPIFRNYPMVAGIDLAGVIERVDEPERGPKTGWFPGDRVLINGCGIGEAYWGGLAQKARVDSDWLVRVPEAFDSRQAMAIGTAGFTAMLSVLALERHGVMPEGGPVLVTGAAGGVGSMAIAILARLGYRVTASTGRLEETEYLRDLGAAAVIDRNELSQAGKPLQAERWSGAIDSVGSYTLANVCAQTMRQGTVAACGLAQGLDFPATVTPFILRGVTLCGIDSVMARPELRREAWSRLAHALDPAKIERMTRVIGLAEAPDMAGHLLAGRVRGRLVVDVNR